MRAVVTGGAGFIGSNLCEGLLKEGFAVISVDDYSAGYEENLRGLDVQQLHCDVSDMYWLQETFSLIGKVDYIFHNAAAKKNVCLLNPLRDMEVNIRGAYNIAHIARQTGAKLIHASTGSVYGETIGRQDENHPLNPVSNYGVSTLAGEKYVSMICPDSVVLRYYHVYGPRQESGDGIGGVVAIWKRRIREGKKIIVYGDGTQLRSFTHVDDVVKANILTARMGRGVYNCVSGYMYTLNDLIRELSFCGNIYIEYQDWQEGDIRDFIVDNSRLTSLGIKWIDLRRGLYEQKADYSKQAW